VANKLWQIRVLSTLGNGADMVSDLHVVDEHSGLIDAAPANEVVDAVWDHIGSSYTNMVDDTAQIGVVVAREVVPPSSGDIPDESSLTVDDTGGRDSGDQRLPMALGALIDWHTDAAIRSGRGWMFSPPAVGSEEFAGGLLVVAGTSLGVRIGEFIDDVTDPWSVGTIEVHNYNFAVYSRTRHARDLPNYFFRITSGSIRTEPAWLRSRLTIP
jgi:hypothetical protein